MVTDEDEPAKSGEIPALSRNGNPDELRVLAPGARTWFDQVSPVAWPPSRNQTLEARAVRRPEGRRPNLSSMTMEARCAT